MITSKYTDSSFFPQPHYSVSLAFGGVKINHQNCQQDTEADGKQYADREKTVPTDVEDKLSGNSLCRKQSFESGQAFRY